MRAFLYALVAALLLASVAGAGWLWRDSAAVTRQLLVRSGGSRAGLVTADRGRVAVLLARGPRVPRAVQLRSVAVDEAVPRLETFCDDSGWGFGLDPLVRTAGLAPPEAAALLTGQESARWRARRLVLPMWVVVAAAAGLALVWWLRFNVPLYRELRGLCRRCAYDVSGSSHFCPVCKHQLPRRTWSGPPGRGA